MDEIRIIVNDVPYEEIVWNDTVGYVSENICVNGRWYAPIPKIKENKKMFSYNDIRDILFQAQGPAWPQFMDSLLAKEILKVAESVMKNRNNGG